MKSLSLKPVPIHHNKRACSDVKKQLNGTVETIRASRKKKGVSVFQKHKLRISEKGCVV